jgi:hypothetical protein
MLTLCAIAATAFSDATGLCGNRAIIAYRKKTKSEEPSAEMATPATITIELCASPTAATPTMIKIQLPIESNRSF